MFIFTLAISLILSVSGLTNEQQLLTATDSIREGPSGWFRYVDYNVGVETTPYMKWMSDYISVIGNMTLKDLTLPGTHDSGAYFLTKDMMKGAGPDKVEELIRIAERFGIPVQDFIMPWALSGNKNIYEQLMGGIRYLDVRSGWDGSTWRTFHFLLGNNIQIILNDIAKFVKEYPSEVLVIEVSHFYGSPTAADEKTLLKSIIDTLGPHLFPVRSKFDFTINDVIKTGRSIILTLDDSLASLSPSVWPGSAIHNTYADSCNLTQMIEFNNDKLQEYKSYTTSEKLFKISWTLTPAASCVEESILPWKAHSLIEMAKVANGKPFDLFYKSALNRKLQLANIMIIDKFDSSNIVKDLVLTAIKQNIY